MGVQLSSTGKLRSRLYASLAACNSSMCCSAQSRIDANGPTSVLPSGVSDYSTVGVVASRCRCTRPSRSRLRSVWHQHFIRNALDAAAELAKPARTLGEQANNERRPPVRDAVQRLSGRALRRVDVVLASGHGRLPEGACLRRAVPASIVIVSHGRACSEEA